jgi:arachidonate 5-lipoxygenase
MKSVADVASLVSGIIFTLTGQHSATHFDALDLYGFIPDVPALMRKPVPTSRDIVVNRDELSATLPDQFPDAYYVSLAYVMQVHKPDEVN